jgi:hypothetical protein
LFPCLLKPPVAVHPIWCPNHLSSFLSTILVNGSWFSIPLICIYTILSLLVFPVHFFSQAPELSNLQKRH